MGCLQKRAPKKEKKSGHKRAPLHSSLVKFAPATDLRSPGETWLSSQTSVSHKKYMHAWIKARIPSDFWDSWARFTRDAPKICKQLDPGIFSKKETMGHAFDWHLPALLSIYNWISVHT